MGSHDGVTRTLAGFATNVSAEQLPGLTEAAAKRIILDTLGCAVGGSMLASSQIVARVKLTGGPEDATVLGTGTRGPLLGCVAVNSHSANVLDAEETIRHTGHLAASVVPPALALAEYTGSSGKDLLAAVAVGFDVAARIGISLRSLDILEDGRIEIAPVSGLTWASFGATVVAGRLIGLSADEMAQAFGVTVALAPLPIAGVWGNMPPPRPMSKYGMYGAMAEAGVSAAMLVKEGFIGDANILDGDRGFWRIVGSSKCVWEAMTDRLGDRWLVEETSFKIYPACRFAAPAVDLFYKLWAELGIDADDIERVEVKVPHAMIAKFMHDATVETLVDGEFSVPHLLGLAARCGPPGPQWHTEEALRDHDVEQFAKRVNVTVFEEAGPILERLIREQGHSELIPTAMTIVVGDRTVYGETDHAIGDPWANDAAVDDDMLEAKFRTFCRDVLSEENIDRAIHLVRDLGEQQTVGPLVEALAGAGSR